MRTIFVVLVVLCLATVTFGADVLRRNMEKRGLAAAQAKSKLVRDGVIDLYLGAMDEESYFTLAQVLKLQASGVYTDVIVIERHSKDWDDETVTMKSMLFERPLTVMASGGDLGNVYYSKVTPRSAVALTKLSDKTVFNCGTGDAQKYSCFVLEQLIAKLAAVDETAWARSKMFGPVKTKQLPLYHMYSFGAPQSPKTPSKVAVVHRLAEMGLQPQLVWPMVTPVLKALKSGDAKINVIAIAAGGVTSSEDKPGSNHLLHSSLFVGLTKAGDKLKGQVRFALDTAADTKQLNLDGTEQNNDKPGRGAAEKAGQAYFLNEAKDAAKTKVIKDEITDESKPTSLTVAFFGGLKDKERANSLGIQDVNMEDYFYIEIIDKVRADGREMPAINNYGVFRVDCDPFDVSADVAPFNLWAKTQRWMSRQALSDILLWGLQGLKMDDMPGAKIDAAVMPAFVVAVDPDKQQGALDANTIKRTADIPAKAALFWKTYLAPAEPSARKDMFGANNLADRDGKPRFIKNGGEVIHPFLIEAATDLLKEAKSGEAVHSDSVKDPVNKLPEEVKTLADKALTAKDATSVTNFVNAWAKFLWDQRASVRNAMKAGSDNNDVAGGIEGKVPIWVRSKWFVGAYQPTTDAELVQTRVKKAPVLEFFQTNSEGTDRIFYKASNFAGLKTLNEMLFDTTTKHYPVDFTLRKAACTTVLALKTDGSDLCAKKADLKEILAFDPAVSAVYTGCDGMPSKAAAVTALKGFCDDNTAKINKF